MSTPCYTNATFLASAADIRQLPRDDAIEIAFAGRSNAGKSSVLNTLTNKVKLARTSKTPGRTQLINLFTIDEKRRLVDLPGYGYAKVSVAIKARWQKTLTRYLEVRDNLKALVLVMDVRHPLKEIDNQILSWATASHLPVHIVLTKTDKLTRNQAHKALSQVKQQLKHFDGEHITVQLFSSHTKIGLDELRDSLAQFF